MHYLCSLDYLLLQAVDTSTSGNKMEPCDATTSTSTVLRYSPTQSSRQWIQALSVWFHRYPAMLTASELCLVMQEPIFPQTIRGPTAQHGPFLHLRYRRHVRQLSFYLVTWLLGIRASSPNSDGCGIEKKGTLFSPPSASSSQIGRRASTIATDHPLARFDRAH